MVAKSKSNFNIKLKFLLFSAIFLALIIAAKFLNLQTSFQSLLFQIKNLGAWGPFAYISIYNLATLLFIPGSILTITAGFLFGLLWGSVYVLIAAMIGATLAFLIGRYLSREWVSRQIQQHQKLQALDLAVAKAGWKIVLLTRLSPLFPFNLLNYVFGVTQVSLKDYVLGSLGIIPGTVMYVYVGSLAGNLAVANMPNRAITPEAQTYQLMLQVMGLIATIVVTIYITKLAQKALNQNMIETDIK